MSKFPKHFDPTLHRSINELCDLVEKDLRIMRPVIQDLVTFGKNKFGREPTCKTCTKPGCCYQLVFATLYDAMPIARRLRMEGKATPQYIAWLRAVGEENESLGRVAWFDSARPCVFLKDKRCTIYEQRPLPCRTYFTWSPSDNCQPDAPPGEDVVGLVENPELARKTIMQQLQFQKLLGIGPENLCAGSLPRILAIVLEGMPLGPAGFAAHVRNQPYPLMSKMGDWMNGENPFGEARRQRERADHGSVEPVQGPPPDP